MGTITFIIIQRGTMLKLETKFFLKLRATKNQKKLIRIAVPSEHQSTNKSKKLDTSLEKFRQVYFFLKDEHSHIDRAVKSSDYRPSPKDEHSHIDRAVKSIDYRPSPIPAGELQIPLTMNFKCPWYITHIKMKEFVSTLHSFDYNGNKEDERDILINELLEESQSDSEVVIQRRKKRKVPLISEPSEESNQ